MSQQNTFNTPFIRKLNYILSQPEYSQIITWDSTGTMIDILDQKKMEMEVLPKFFRHGKFQSFIRQLNLYGFRKIKKIDAHRFRHPDLVKKSSLFLIKSQRKNKNSIKKDQIQRLDQLNNSYIDQNLLQEVKNSSKDLTQEFEENQNLKNYKDNILLLESNNINNTNKINNNINNTINNNNTITNSHHKKPQTINQFNWFCVNQQNQQPMMLYSNPSMMYMNYAYNLSIQQQQQQYYNQMQVMLGKCDNNNFMGYYCNN